MADVFSKAAANPGHSKPSRYKPSKRSLNVQLRGGGDETSDNLQAILNTQGEHASVELHKSCYCSYTSKEHVKKFVTKRKAESVCSDETPTVRIRRSQVIDFDFKRQCLFCAKVCEPACQP